MSHGAGLGWSLGRMLASLRGLQFRKEAKSKVCVSVSVVHIYLYINSTVTHDCNWFKLVISIFKIDQ